MDAKGDQGSVCRLMDETVRNMQEMKAKKYCENQVVNSILSLKSRAASERGIKVKISAGVPENLDVTPLDLCSLFCNLMGVL